MHRQLWTVGMLNLTHYHEYVYMCYMYVHILVHAHSDMYSLPQ